MNYNDFSKEQLIEMLEKMEKENKEILNTNKMIEKRNIDLIALNIQAKKEIKELNKLNHKSSVEFSKLMVNYKKINIALDAAILKYENKNEIAKRDAYNLYVGKKETSSRVERTLNEAEVNVDKDVPKRGRKKGGSNYIKKLVPSRTIIVEPDEKYCVKCNEALIEIGEDRTLKIIKIPASYEVVEIISKKYACKDRCDNKIYQKVKTDAFGNSPITPSVVADIINLKYNLAVPLYRFSKYLTSIGVNISTMCMSNYVLKAADMLKPIYEQLKYNLVNNMASVIHCDETEIKCLEFEDRQKSYMFAYTTSFYDEPIYLYEFSENRTTEKTVELLNGFSGYLVVDGYAGYDKFTKMGIKIQRCLVHSRRYFYDIVKSLKTSEIKMSVANNVLTLMGKIFHEESLLVDSDSGIDEIKDRRQSSEYQALIKDLHDYVWAQNAPENSLLDKALKYTKNQWDELFTYVENGYVDCSNSICERAIKPFTLIRKNSLFSKTESGAQASAILFSIVQTAKANGLVPEKYLTYVFENLNKLSTQDLMPSSDTLPDDIKIAIYN
ncbi:MAG: IS66 family transposase [Mycoplasmatota bacterium]